VPHEPHPRGLGEEVRRLLEDDYPQAETVTLVCDNLNTHAVASLYHRFDAEPLAICVAA